jgi:hypothetical protein
VIHYPFCIVGSAARDRYRIFAALKRMQDKHDLHIIYAFKCVSVSTGMLHVLGYMDRRFS